MQNKHPEQPPLDPDGDRENSVDGRMAKLKAVAAAGSRSVVRAFSGLSISRARNDADEGFDLGDMSPENQRKIELARRQPKPEAKAKRPGQPVVAQRSRFEGVFTGRNGLFALLAVLVVVVCAVLGSRLAGGTKGSDAADLVLIGTVCPVVGLDDLFMKPLSGGQCIINDGNVEDKSSCDVECKTDYELADEAASATINCADGEWVVGDAECTTKPAEPVAATCSADLAKYNMEALAGTDQCPVVDGNVALETVCQVKCAGEMMFADPSMNQFTCGDDGEWVRNGAACEAHEQPAQPDVHMNDRGFAVLWDFIPGYTKYLVVIGDIAPFSTNALPDGVKACYGVPDTHICLKIEGGFDFDTEYTSKYKALDGDGSEVGIFSAETQFKTPYPPPTLSESDVSFELKWNKIGTYTNYKATIYDGVDSIFNQQRAARSRLLPRARNIRSNIKFHCRVSMARQCRYDSLISRLTPMAILRERSLSRRTGASAQQLRTAHSRREMAEVM
eukprot:107725_1